MNPAKADPRELLARAGWLRALAASLIADPAAADDVAQDTLVAALAHPPRADRPLEPWLARVARNFAGKRRRGEGRRAAHELLAAHAGEPPTPAQIAERLELSRTLVEAVTALEEPLRTTLVLRYFEDRTSVEIARMQRVPEGTVRWRIQRGLALLRERLDARFGGDRAAWSVMLVPLALRHGELAAGAAAAGTVGTTTQGVLAMSATVKIGATVAAAALAGVLWWNWREGAGEATLASASAAPAAEHASPEAARSLAAPADEVRATRAEAAPAAAPASAPAAAAPAADAPVAAPPALVDVRFVDAQGAPWTDVRLLARTHSEPISSRSGADGRARLSVPAPYAGVESWEGKLAASRPGCATRVLTTMLRPGETAHLGEIVLGPGVALYGRVVDADGNAVEGANVGLAPAELEERDDGRVHRFGSERFLSDPTATSARDGTFALEGAAPGKWRLWAKGDAMRFGWTEPFDVVAESDRTGLEVAVAPFALEDRIEGRVVDPDGNPVAGAGLAYQYQNEYEIGTVNQTVGDDGTFSILLYYAVPYSFAATDPQGRWSEAVAKDVAPGMRGLLLTLGAKRFLEVKVRDADHRPVEGCTFDMQNEKTDWMIQQAGHVIAASGKGGQAGEDVAPGDYRLGYSSSMPFTFSVSAPGFVPQHFGPYAADSAPASLDVVLARAPVIRGRVRAEGRPLAGAKVELRIDMSDRYYIRNGFQCVVDPNATATATSDAEGRFEIACELTQKFWLLARADGWSNAELGPIAPAAIAAGGFDLELTYGGAIEGRVTTADGRGAEGAIVGVNHGDGAPRTLRAGPDGFYRFEGLAPGNWQVRLCDEELNPGSVTSMISDHGAPIEWTCEVVVGRAARRDLVVPQKQ